MLKWVPPNKPLALSDARLLLHLAEVAQTAHAEGDLVMAEAFIALTYATGDIRYDDALVLEHAA